MNKLVIFLITILSLIYNSNFCYSYNFNNNIKNINEGDNLENAMNLLSRMFEISKEEAYGVYIITDMESFAKICNEKFKNNIILNAKNKLFRSKQVRDAYNYLNSIADYNLPDRDAYCWYGRKAYKDLLK